MNNNFSPPPIILTGGCMCGAVRYELNSKPITVGLCHCNRCRPQSGTSFSMVAFFERSGLFLKGETAVFDDIGTSGLRVLRRYCPKCGSPLTTEPDIAPTIFFLKTGGLDQTDWLHPNIELFVTRRLAWVSPVPGATQYEGNPPI